MRRFLICMFMALTLGAAAQGHIDFGGTSVDGSLATCVKALRKAGYKPKYREPDCHWLRGKFYGDEVDLMVATTAASGVAYMFMVSYPLADTWSELRGKYDYVKMRLSVLYGEPGNVLEKFVWPYTEADGMKAVEYGKCNFVSTWSLPEGEVSVTIAGEGRVQVFFMDKENMALAGQEAQ